MSILSVAEGGEKKVVGRRRRRWRGMMELMVVVCKTRVKYQPDGRTRMTGQTKVLT